MSKKKHMMRMESTDGQGKVRVVMREFGQGKLHSSSGQKVKSRRQAVAIAMSEAGLARKRKR